MRQTTQFELLLGSGVRCAVALIIHRQVLLQAGQLAVRPQSVRHTEGSQARRAVPSGVPHNLLRVFLLNDVSQDLGRLRAQLVCSGFIAVRHDGNL